MQPFNFMAFVPEGAPEGADDIAKARIIASITTAMCEVPATARPKAYLAEHLATLTDHILFSSIVHRICALFHMEPPFRQPFTPA